MRKPGGYIVSQGPEGLVYEHDTFTCKHCNAVVIVRNKTEGGWCFRCAANICAKCADIGRCFPFEKQLEVIEKRITNRVNDGRMFARLGIR